jgi:DNA-binding CsgD family transcriptional regulator
VIAPAEAGTISDLLLRIHGLSRREREITELLLRGVPNEAAAKQRFISRHMHRTNLKAVFAKVGVDSRPELMAHFASASCLDLIRRAVSALSYGSHPERSGYRRYRGVRSNG